jgi:PEP-CTERM motif
MLRNTLFCGLAIACFATFALADNTNDLNISLTMDCQSGRYCYADPGSEGSPATAYADFSGIGEPWTFNTTTGEAIQWVDNDGNYSATFGYGGSFQMTGPNGLTFIGVVTSGSAEFVPDSWTVQVNYTGEWSNGVFASGEAEVQVGDGGAFTEATLQSQATPEPSSILLLGSGVAGVILRKRFCQVIG